MKLTELHEGEVVKANFGGGKNDAAAAGVDIPQGYDRFEVSYTDGDKTAKIIGIKGDKRKVISTTDPRLAKELVKLYNGGKSDIQKVSVMRAFGSPELADLDEAGVHLAEKPSYWEDLELEGYHGRKHGLIDEVKLKRIEKIIGRKLKSLPSDEIYGGPLKPKSPLATVRAMPNDRMFIVGFQTRSGIERYLADSTGATKYIRFWAKIA